MIQIKIAVYLKFSHIIQLAINYRLCGVLVVNKGDALFNAGDPAAEVVVLTELRSPPIRLVSVARVLVVPELVLNGLKEVRRSGRRSFRLRLSSGDGPCIVSVLGEGAGDARSVCPSSFRFLNFRYIQAFHFLTNNDLEKLKHQSILIQRYKY